MLEGQYDCCWDEEVDSFPEPMYPDCWDEDQKALDELLAAVEKRRSKAKGEDEDEDGEGPWQHSKRSASAAGFTVDDEPFQKAEKKE